MKYLELGGIRWAYQEQGSGPLVIMSHGTFLDHSLWDSLADTLSPHFRCIQLDLPGHGQSGFWPKGWTVDDLVSLYPEMIRQLGEERAVLAGLSIGGAISLRVAVQHPQSVSALVYMDAAVDSPGLQAVAGLQALAQLLGSLEDETQRAALLTAESFQHHLHTPGWRANHPELAAHELQVQLSHPREAYSHLANVVASLQPMSARLGEVQCPMLTLFGADDLGVHWADVVEKGVKHASVHRVANAGHHLPYDNAAECNRLVMEFLLAQKVL